MTSMEETLRNYNAKRAAKEAERLATAEANKGPPKLAKCGKCQAPCTGTNVSLGVTLCDPCFDRRLDEQTPRG